jgi:hypothetical protein
MSTVPPTTFMGSAKALFEDPNFIQMLGGIGAQMDPQGAGGILGRAAVTGSRNKAAQDLAAKMLAGRDADRAELNARQQALLDRLGPVTLPGTPGLNSYKPLPHGAMQLNLDTGDPLKMMDELGGSTPKGKPGVTSFEPLEDGSFNFVVDPPEVKPTVSVADQVDDFAPGNLYNPRAPQKLSYTPVNQQERISEMADLMQTNLPPAMFAAMKTPTVQRVAGPTPSQSDIDNLTGQPQPRRSLRRNY